MSSTHEAPASQEPSLSRLAPSVYSHPNVQDPILKSAKSFYQEPQVIVPIRGFNISSSGPYFDTSAISRSQPTPQTDLQSQNDLIAKLTREMKMNGGLSGSSDVESSTLNNPSAKLTTDLHNVSNSGNISSLSCLNNDNIHLLTSLTTQSNLQQGQIGSTVTSMTSSGQEITRGNVASLGSAGALHYTEEMMEMGENRRDMATSSSSLTREVIPALLRHDYLNELGLATYGASLEPSLAGIKVSITVKIKKIIYLKIQFILFTGFCETKVSWTKAKECKNEAINLPG